MSESMIAKRAHWLGFALGAAGLAAHNAYLQPWTLDDAFISFRYAEHFATGQGLVYNAGEFVEGYTTFLWVFLLGLGHFVGFDTLILSKFLGLLFGLATLGLVANAHRFIPSLPNHASALAAVMLGSCGIFTGWAMSGMEVTMVACWSTLAVLLHFRSLAEPANRTLCHAVGASCALAAMSRPEFGLVFLVLFADRLADGIRNKNSAYLHFAAAFALVYVPYFAWRYWYYGWLLPNTFYAKVGSSWAQLERGLAYCTRFAPPAALILAPIAAGAIVSDAVRRSYGRAALLLSLILAAHTCFVIAVGGDVMPNFRFFSPIMPLLCLLAGISLVALNRSRARTTLLVAVIAAFNVWELSHHHDLHRRIVNEKVGFHGEETGLWLKNHAGPDAVLATNTAGGLAYYSGLRVIDMLGLNDEHIAHRQIPNMGSGRAGHEKGDGAYVLSLKPDFIQFGSVHGNTQPEYRSGWEMYRTPQFRRWYELKSYTLPSGARLHLYERRDQPRQAGPPR